MVLVICAIFGLKKWRTVFSIIEQMNCTNRVSFFKTLYLNYNSLPYKQAKAIPIHVYTKTQIISSAGQISIEDCKLGFGMIRWGWFHSFRSQGKTRIQNRGHIVFKGTGKILNGSEISVFPDATLTICDSFFIGENVLIYCQENIYLSVCVRVSYQSDISDSDFHYMINTEDGSIYRKTLPIVIGAYNWIGSRTTIKKGTCTPDHIVVASGGSLLSKDYRTNIEPYSILGGCPARVLKKGMSRVWQNEFANIEEFDAKFKEIKRIEIPKPEILSLTKL